MTDRRLCLFALQATSALGAAVAAALDQNLAAHEEREFEDGEHKTRPLETVRGADVYVLHSLNGETDQNANDKLCRLLFFIGALEDAGAARVTALAPYLCYSRKDRRTKPNDPVTTRYVAALFEAVGTDAVVTLDVHNPAAFENAFRCPTVALTAAPLFVDYAKALGDERLCVVSPDTGGAKRADLFHEALEAALGRPVGKAFADKRRSAGRRLRRSVRRRRQRRDRARHRRSHQHRRHAGAGGARRATRRRQARGRFGDPRPVHAGRRRGAARSGDRSSGRDRQRRRVPARGRSPRQARRDFGGAAARRMHPPPARRADVHRSIGILRLRSIRTASAAASRK